MKLKGKTGNREIASLVWPSGSKTFVPLKLTNTLCPVCLPVITSLTIYRSDSSNALLSPLVAWQLVQIKK